MTTNRVVVGLSASERGLAALAWALEQRRNDPSVEIVAVRVLKAMPTGLVPPYGADLLTIHALHQEARREQIAVYRQLVEAVDPESVRLRIMEGSLVACLAEACRSALRLVLGADGPSRLTKRCRKRISCEVVAVRGTPANPMATVISPHARGR